MDQQTASEKKTALRTKREKEEGVFTVDTFEAARAWIATQSHPGPGFHWAYCKHPYDRFVEVYVARNAPVGF